VNVPPVVTQVPIDSEICAGSNTSFIVSATGSGLTYQWQVDMGGGFVNLTDVGVYSGTNTPILGIFNAPATMNGYIYRAVVSGICAPPAESAQAVLTVNTAPVVTISPVSQVVCVADNLFFEAAATGTNVTYQWQVSIDGGIVYFNLSNDGIYSGVDTDRLDITNVNASMNSYRYRAVASGTCPPAVATGNALLTVQSPPAITTQPVNTTLCENTDANLSVTATGVGLNYQWQVDDNLGGGFVNVVNGGVYSGATTNTLSLTGVPGSMDNYKFRVEITGTCNPPVISTEITLTVRLVPHIITQPVSDAICELTSTAFTVVAGGHNPQFQWERFSGGVWVPVSNSAIYSGVNTPVLNISAAPVSMNGNRYRLRVSGTCTPDAISDEVTLTVFNNPTPTITPDPAAVAVLNPLPMNGNPVGGTGTYVTHTWTGDIAGLSATNIVNPIYTPPLTGTYNLTYTVEDSNGCIGTDDIEVTVTVAITVDLFPDPAEVCADSDLQLTAVPSGGSGVYVVHEWTGDIGPLSNPNIQNPVFNSAVSGVYNLTYTVTDNLGIQGTNSMQVTVFARPTANITGDGTFPLVCGGTPLQLDGNPAGGSGVFTTHQWTGQTGPLSATNIQNPVFMSVINGNYNLNYRVTDSNGCISDQVSVSIQNDMPSAVFSHNGLPGCTPMTVNFNNTSLNAINYEWDFGDGSPVVNTISPDHTFENLTPTIQYFVVRLTAYTANGCSHFSEQTITVYPGIDASFVMSTDSICAPGSISFEAQPGALSYFWNYGDGVSGYAGPVTSHGYTNITGSDITRTVTLTTESFFGCIDQTTEDVVIHFTPVALFSASPPFQTFPASTVTFTNLGTSGPGITFLWDFGDSNSSTDENPVHVYAGPGDYDVTLTVSNEYCSSAVTFTVVIAPIPPIASFDFVAPGCSPLTVTFNNTSQYATSYRWEFPDGSMSTEANPTHTFFDAGSQLVRLYAFGPGGQDDTSQEIIVYISPVAFLNVAPNYVYVNEQHVVAFNLSTNLPNTGVVTYIWDFGDGTTVTVYSTESPIHMYTQTGVYDVSLTVQTENGCSDTYIKEQAVTVDSAGRLIFPTAFRPGDSSTDGEIDPNDPEQRNRVFYPGIIEKLDEYHMMIFNRWGELIFETRDQNVGWDGFINKVKAKQDVYIYKVTGKYTTGRAFVIAGDVTLLR
jgi:gliding motility-associated-like protein